MDHFKKALSVFLVTCVTLILMLWSGVFVMPSYADTKSIPYITVTVSDSIILGQGPVTKVVMPSDATGRLNLKIYNTRSDRAVQACTRIMKPEMQGEVTYIEPGLTEEGSYFVEAVYDGDEKYEPNTVRSDIFYVIKDDSITLLPPSITVETKDITFGQDETLTVIVPSDATGTITAEIWNPVTNINYTITAESDMQEGQWQQTLSGLSAGYYNVRVLYSGDNHYQSYGITEDFSVKKVSSTTVTTNDIIVGKDAEIEITVSPTDATGTVQVTVALQEGDSKHYTVSIPEGNQGKASLTLDKPSAGRYTVTATYDGNTYYETSNSKPCEFTVSKTTPEAPVVGKADCTTEANNNGKIIGVNSTMEYQRAGALTWNTIGNNVDEIWGLTPGTYYVRYKETETANASKAAEVEIKAYSAPKPKLTITVKDQSYVYDGKPHGEADPAYNDPAVINQKVTVEGLLKGDTVTSIVLTGTATEIGEYPGCLEITNFTINDPQNDGKDKYICTLIPGKLTITKPLTLESIAITTPPAKTSYIEGESFDPAGMVVTAAYSDQSTAEIKNYTFKPDGALKTSDKTIKVSYTEGGITKTAEQEITVRKKDEPHVHTLKLVDAKEATCTEDGNTPYYVCTGCGKWFEDATALVEITDKSSVIIKALGHEWDQGVVTKEATYTEEGIRTYTCLRNSSHTKTEPIPKKKRSSGGSGSSGGSRTVTVRSGSWSQDSSGWHYTENGVLVKNAWRYLSYNGVSYWYFFDESGTMKTGWLEQEGKRYYLYPESDGWKGRMLTGWQQIEGKWYYFETAPGSTQGRMYHDERTPDGFWMGPDGAWDGSPANTGI